MRGRILAVCCLIGTVLAAASASAQDFYIEADSINFSDTFSIGTILNGLEGGRLREGGEVSFTHNQGAIGTHWKGFDFAVTGRFDYFAEYAPGVGELLFAEANDLPIEDGEFGLDLVVNRVEAYGARFGYRRGFLKDRLKLGAHLSLLGTRNLLDGETSGSAVLSNDGSDLEADFSVDYIFDEDLLLGMEVDAPNGFGLTFDIEAELDLTDKWAVRVEVNDLWSRIRWYDAPRTIATASTDTVETDDDGLLVVRPFLEGQNSVEDATQRYFTRIHGDLKFRPTPKWQLSQSLFNIRDVILTTSQVSYAITKGLSVSAEYEWISQALGFGVSWRGFHAGLSSNTIDFSEATYLKASLGFKHRF